MSNIVLLTPISFATNNTFLGSVEEDFETHITGLSSTLLHHLDINPHQVALVSDDGDRTIKSRGLTFLSVEALALFLDLVTAPTIASAACTLTPHFLCSNQPHGELVIKWLHTSSTK